MSQPIDLRPDHEKRVRDILAQFKLPGVAVLAFGSRAKWTAKAHSDLDLALKGNASLSASLMAQLAEAFSESELPFKVDVVDWRAVGPGLQEAIDRDGVALRVSNTALVSREATLRLGDHCLKIGSGATPRGGKETYSDEGPFSLIRSQNVLNTGFSKGGLVRISAKQANQLRNVEVRPADVLLNITGDSVARACQVADDVLPARVNQHVAIIRPHPDEIDPRFLRYFLITPSTQSKMLGLAAAGATRNALTKSMIEDFRVPALHIDLQRAIGSILGALDDKIDLNRRMNETLEALALAIFKDWFIDFGPTRAKAEGHPPYLAPDVWALFPDRLDAEGKPDGWDRLDLREAADVLSGGTPDKSHAEYWGGDIPWISPKVMTGMHVSTSDELVTPVAIGNGTRMAKSGSVLLMVRGMGLHQRVRISQARGDVSFNQDVKALIPRRIASSHLLFAMLDAAPILFSKVEASGHGTGKLPTDIIETIEFVSPVGPAYAQLVSPLEAINEKIALNNEESITLAATRDLLLPKLMSGEIRVREAERVAGRAA